LNLVRPAADAAGEESMFRIATRFYALSASLALAGPRVMGPAMVPARNVNQTKRPMTDGSGRE
jgi:hypothetical protein